MAAKLSGPGIISSARQQNATRQKRGIGRDLPSRFERRYRSIRTSPPHRRCRLKRHSFVLIFKRSPYRLRFLFFGRSRKTSPKTLAPKDRSSKKRRHQCPTVSSNFSRHAPCSSSNSRISIANRRSQQGRPGDAGRTFVLPSSSAPAPRAAISVAPSTKIPGHSSVSYSSNPRQITTGRS